MLCCKCVSLIGLFARNQRIHGRIFRVYHPVKITIVLLTNVSVFYISRSNLSPEAA